MIAECPICGKIIPAYEYTAAPERFEKIKTRRRSVVLVHKTCVEKEKIANEHK